MIPKNMQMLSSWLLVVSTLCLNGPLVVAFQQPVLLRLRKSSRCSTSQGLRRGGQQGQQQQHHKQAKQRLLHIAPFAATTTTTTTTTTQSPTSLRSQTSSSSETKSETKKKSNFQHVVAILTMPSTSRDRIANEAILNTALAQTNKLSVVLTCQDQAPTLSSLRRYVGEVYSQLWDFAMSTENAVDFNDCVVYPQNLPNAAAETWIYHCTDVDGICSHESACGWISNNALGQGKRYQTQTGQGVGGLDEHVEAVNADRAERNLSPVQAIHVPNFPVVATSDLEEQQVVFVDDEVVNNMNAVQVNQDDDDDDDDSDNMYGLLGGPSIPSQSLYNCVAVGGTFDGMHYGHRKLLTLAVSSVLPVTGKLMVGVTVDEMLQSKAYKDYIPPLKERIQGVKEFLYRLAPGIKNRISILPISDTYGPPGRPDEVGKEFDALVLSHETLENGIRLNEYRQDTLNMPPLKLLCTRRTEAFGMSSTTLRKLRSQLDFDGGDNDAKD